MMNIYQKDHNYHNAAEQEADCEEEVAAEGDEEEIVGEW